MIRSLMRRRHWFGSELANVSLGALAFTVIFAPAGLSQATSSKASTVLQSSTGPSYQSLSQLIARDPRNATAYYLRGCLLMKAGNAKALQDFDYARRLAPGTTIDQYSRLAISRLGQSAQVKPKDEPAPDADVDETDDAKEAASTGTKDKGAPPNDTIALIRKQAQTARTRAIETGKIEAQEEVSKADSQAKSAQDRLQRQAMEAALGKYGGEQRFDPYSFISPAQVDSFRAQAAATAERVRNLGKLKAGFKEQEGQEKASEIDYQAENLERQLKDNHPLSGIKLNSVGTNLYTRNYALVPPTVKPIRAQALPSPFVSTNTGAALKSNSKDTKADLSKNPLASQTIDAHGNRIKASVKGQLLPTAQKVSR